MHVQTELTGGGAVHSNDASRSVGDLPLVEGPNAHGDFHRRHLVSTVLGYRNQRCANTVAERCGAASINRPPPAPWNRSVVVRELCNRKTRLKRDDGEECAGEPPGQAMAMTTAKKKNDGWRDEVERPGRNRCRPLSWCLHETVQR